MSQQTKSMELDPVDDTQIARVCLELAGGGYSVAQTFKAIGWQRILREKGKLKVKSSTGQHVLLTLKKS